MTTAKEITFVSPDQGEEAARAGLYGLLASLFCAPPAQELIDTIASSDVQGESPLESAWMELALACRRTSSEKAREEYESLFLGVGKPEVMLYGSYYLSGFLMEKPLAALRSDLSKLGLERPESVIESEDHIASLCEVMRFLIVADDPMCANLAAQKEFFAAHVQPWVSELCAAIRAHPHAHFYAPVSKLAQAFFEVEALAFDMA